MTYRNQIDTHLKNIITFVAEIHIVMNKTLTESNFKKNSKGDIILKGSGKFFRDQKTYYSNYSAPYLELYNDQIKRMLENSKVKI